MAMQSPQERAVEALYKSYPFFASECLHIKTDKGIEKFNFNRVQHYIHFRAEDQLRRKKVVRMVLVKARQQGGSEYIAGRGYKYAVQHRAKTVYILSHESSSTQTLFAKVDRYQKYCPDYIKPSELASNRNQKKFSNDSEYTVGTAGSENTGRSNTVQFLHLSEPAHYDSDEGIKSGVLQTVSDAPFTEIWWETTARGKNWFYKFVLKILAGDTEYELIFVPWFWTDKYRKTPPSDFKRTDEENLLSSMATTWDTELCQIVKKPLDDAQLYWRRLKIAELGERLFKQEYPATLEEAFQASGENFFDPMLVEKARKSETERDEYAPLIIMCDPGRSRDRTIIMNRQGHKMFDLEKHRQMDQMRLAGILAERIDYLQADKCFIDAGMGHGTYDRLVERGYGKIVELVNFGGAAEDPRYLNKRAEMAFRLNDWLKEGDPSMPDDDELATDFAAMPDFELTSNGKIKFPSKEEIKKLLGLSPDILDTAMLSFAERVRPRNLMQQPSRAKNVSSGSSLTTLARIRKRAVQSNTDGFNPPRVQRSRIRGN